MAVALDQQGRVAVLDQVNGRIQVFREGKLQRQVPVARTAQDVAFAARGYAVLDRLGAGEIATVAPTGQVVARVPLDEKVLGRGRTAGGVTGIGVDGDGYWLDWGHQAWLRVAGPDGAPLAEPVPLAGIPDGRGGFLRATLQVGGAVTVETEGGRTELRFGDPVQAILALAADDNGAVHVAVRTVRRDAGQPDRVEAQALWAVVLTRDGREEGRQMLDDTPDAPHEMLRPLRFAPDGRAFWLAVESKGLRIKSQPAAGGAR